MRTCLFFDPVNLRKQGFFCESGAEQVIRPDSQNEAKGKLPEINRLHDLPVFWQNRACNSAEEAATSAGTRQGVAKNRRCCSFGLSQLRLASTLDIPTWLAPRMRRHSRLWRSLIAR
jgi:hypothetical protein